MPRRLLGLPLAREARANDAVPSDSILSVWRRETLGLDVPTVVQAVSGDERHKLNQKPRHR